MSKYKYYGLMPSVRQRVTWIDDANSSYEKYANELLVWDCDNKVWTSKSMADFCGVRYLTFAPVFSVRSAKRHLKKHSEIPDGTEFVLKSRLYGIPNEYFVK